MENSDQRTNPVETGMLSRHQAPTLLLSLATVLAFFLCYEMISEFLPAICWALVLAVVGHPLYLWLADRVKNENLAATLAVVVVGVVLVAPIVYITQQLVSEASKLVVVFKNQATNDNWDKMLEEHPQWASLWERIQKQTDLPSDVPKQMVGGMQWMGEKLSTVLVGSVMFVFQLGLALFLLFYLFRDWRAGLRTLRSLVPLSEGETDQLFRRVGDTINTSVYGTVALSVLKGVMAGVCFWLLGVSSPLLWAVLTALTSVVPIVGTAVIWIPLALYIGATGSWTKAIYLAVWCGVVINAVEHFLYPLVMGQRLRLHPMAVFFALIGGLAFFGASGLVLGPVVLAVTVGLIEIWRRRWMGQEPPAPMTHPG